MTQKIIAIDTLRPKKKWQIGKMQVTKIVERWEIHGETNVLWFDVYGYDNHLMMSFNSQNVAFITYMTEGK